MFPFQCAMFGSQLSTTKLVAVISGASYLAFFLPLPFPLPFPLPTAFLSLTKCNSWILHFADGRVFGLPHFSCLCPTAWCFSRSSSQALICLPLSRPAPPVLPLPCLPPFVLQPSHHGSFSPRNCLRCKDLRKLQNLTSQSFLFQQISSNFYLASPNPVTLNPFPTQAVNT